MPQAPQYRPISQDEISFYREHGYVVLRQILPPQILELGRSVCDQWVDRKIDEWVEAGQLSERFEELPREQRFIVAWEAAGKPAYSRQGTHYNFHEDMYNLLTHPLFLDITESILQTQEITVSGTNNVRLKHPALPWTVVNWHADVYYWNENEARDFFDMLVAWYPLSPVNLERGCLQLISTKETTARDWQVTGDNVFLPPKEVEKFPINSVPMMPGDLLLFSDYTLHRSVPNLENEIIWTIDHRYERTDARINMTKRFGLVARSADRNNLSSLEQWLNQAETRASTKN